MSSRWRKVVIVLRLCWIWNDVSAYGELFERNITLTWNESRKHCQDIGKVLFDVKESKSETILRDILNDTDQTWVSAAVEYSHFVNVPVCMGTSNQLIANKTFDTDVIGNCLKFCNGNLYAGLKDRDCFCFKDAGKLTRSMGCSSTCKNDPVHQCGGNESISLYEKVDKTIIQYKERGYKECVYAKKTSRVTELFTGSCVGQVANGAICEGGNDTACRQHNWTLAGANLCRMDLAVPLRWMQAKKHCADIGGRLMNARKLDFNMRENSTYWFGFYRIPMIHKAEVGNKSLALQSIENDTYCAVARREGDLVLIEGEDCLTKHAILCQDPVLERSSSSPQSTEKPISGERSNSEPTDGTIIYGVATVSAILLVAFAITALVCVLRRRHQIAHQLVEVTKTDSSGEQHALLKRQITNPPAKPSRKTHTKKENLQSSYENVVFIRRGQDVAVQQPARSNFAEDASYKIDLDKEHIYENENKEGATHVRDDEFLHVTEDQDDLTVLSGVKIPVRNEIYDRTTLRQTLDTAHFAHVEEGVVDSETGKQIDKDYDTTEGQN